MEFRGDELTEAERQELRRMIEEERRVRWFWAVVRVWAGWVSAAVISGYGIYQVAKEVLVGWWLR